MNSSQRRLLQIFAFLAVWAVIVVGRLVQVQLVRHEHYMNRALRQQERTLSLNPVRGSIVDANGRVLAESISAESIYADPQGIGDRRAVARSIASVRGIGMTAAEIEAKLKTNAGFAWIARQVPMEVAAAVRAKKIPGVDFVEEHRRSYPRASLAANVIGYTGLDGEGLAGIEHSLDRNVRGRAGKVTILRDARRGMYLVGGEGSNSPVNGDNVVLTLDSVIQFIAERALANAAEKYRAAGGSVVIMDPRSGDILAMASWPTFDPNRFGQGTADGWRNRVVQDQYEPGSTFKIITAAAGLEEGVVTPSQMIDCNNGSIEIANVSIREHGGHRYGLMSFEDVLAHSSNVGTIKVGLALGQRRFHDYIKRFGFGARTGIPLPGEAPGLVRPTQKWSTLSNASMSIGQEIAVTPLQIVRAVSAVANDGVMMEPRLVDRIVDGDGNVILRPERKPGQRVISQKTAALLNEILKGVVLRGTGGNAALAEHVVAGKTGTAQKAGRGGYSDKVVASFVGYVPADRPRLVMLVVIDDPKGAQYGGTVAAPVFREVAEASLRYLGVPPSVPTRSVPFAPQVLAAFSQPALANAGMSAVPDLTGLDARAAIAQAVAAGYTVRTRGSGVVRAQEPAAGSNPPAVRQLELQLEPASAPPRIQVPAPPVFSEVAR
jgi:cell division protein FtsI (penicillin-binding protein 3)